MTLRRTGESLPSTSQSHSRPKVKDLCGIIQTSQKTGENGWEMDGNLFLEISHKDGELHPENGGNVGKWMGDWCGNSGRIRATGDGKFW